MNLEKIKSIEKKTFNELMNFQKETVKRICKLFKKGQNRVLIADEVGLGKTMVAKGIIAKIVKEHFCDKKSRNKFKIVYVCSNQAIANQNIQKINIFKKEVKSETRLSMQFLQILKMEKDEIQLIPLTPQTSFNMTNPNGIKSERALIYVILIKIEKFEENSKLSNLFRNGIKKNIWKDLVKKYEEEVKKIDNDSIKKFKEQIGKEIKNNKELNDFLKKIKEKSDSEIKNSNKKIIKSLRIIFAKISVEFLNPSIVIMDEFQRFKYLLDSSLQNFDENGEIVDESLKRNENKKDDINESKIITEKFFKNKKLKIVLLSATPYKAYATKNEVGDSKDDVYYKEFMEVIDFLINDKEKMKKIKEKWERYIKIFENFKNFDRNAIKLKEQIENEMYKFMCRTERISIEEKNDYIDEEKKEIRPMAGDINTFIAMGKILNKIKKYSNRVIDYAKSAPYLMSYLNGYDEKYSIENYFKKNKKKQCGELLKTIRENKEFLFIDNKKIIDYKEIPSNNEKLEKLKEEIFKNGSELYLWVPPSRPYYNLEGVYKGSKDKEFSKILIFSKWAMVPKMIGTLISYDEEVRTVGELVKRKRKSKKKQKNLKYNAKRRYPEPELYFKNKDGRPQSMSLFCLLYPSKTLSDLYNPIEYLNKKNSLSDIRKDVKNKVKSIFDEYKIKNEYCCEKNIDEKWYYLAPIILDKIKYKNEIKEFKEAIENVIKKDGEKSEKNSLKKHLDELMSLIEGNKKLGKFPDDLYDVIADMTIGSFAVCVYRTYMRIKKYNSCKQVQTEDLGRIYEIADTFLKYFNTTEAIAAVMLGYDEKSNKSDKHWKKVLKYCCDGGFQAMLDEYIHVLGVSIENLDSSHELLKSSLRTRTANYVVDTFKKFNERVKKKKNNKETQKMTSLRSHYAIAFAKNEDQSDKTSRVDDIRKSFNSPMRPFVLATTSIGQEGLDFHCYCKKIIHWNLPSNPVDIEQREGRINRYKCLAIRQDIAEQLKEEIFKKDVWDELFNKAKEKFHKKGQIDLIPYWSLGSQQKIKIKRIIPMYSFSREWKWYDKLKEILLYYRLVMGQPKQEETLNIILRNYKDEEKKEDLKKLFIDLCPFNKKNK